MEASSRGYWGPKIQILIVGIGALGGTIAARAICTGLPVRLAARNTDSAEALRDRACECAGASEEEALRFVNRSIARFAGS
jgi:3-hydroxyisobutyrate dehydrogenase-like beta-hydroxyacid dehydrogenase